MPYAGPILTAIGESAPALTAIGSVLAAGTSTYSAIEGSKARKGARREQAKQQATSEGAAAKASREAAERQRKAEAKAPIVESLLSRNTIQGNPTMLSGGVDPSMLDLARTTLLGG